MKRSELCKLRDARGFLDVTQLEGVCERRQILATNASYLYQLEDCALIYKKYASERDALAVGAFNEVLYAQLSKRWGLACAEYEFATYGAESGTISYFVNGNFRTLYEILAQHTGETSPQVIDRTQMTFSRISAFLETVYPAQYSTLRDELLRLIVLDALVGHADKNSTNLLLVEADAGKAHLCSVDGSDLWGRLISLSDRGEALAWLLTQVTDRERPPLTAMIEAFDATYEINALADRYPAYREIADKVIVLAEKTKQTVLAGMRTHPNTQQDYLLCPSRTAEARCRHKRDFH